MVLHCESLFFFFFKQKTAYEMRINDWSSDVCSSDLAIAGRAAIDQGDARRPGQRDDAVPLQAREAAAHGLDGQAQIIGDVATRYQIGRASCRERVCQYV